MSLLDIATLGLRIDARQVRDADRELDRMGRTGQRVEGQVDRVSNAMKRMAQMAAAVGSALAVVEAIKIADQMSLLDSRLKLATKSMQEFAQATRDVYDIAQKNSVSVQSLTELYVKLSDPIRRVGGGINEVRGVVDAFSTAMRVGGASSEDAARAVLQFSQAMGQGKLSGDEFNSIAESSPRFLKAIAEGANLPIEQLKKLGAEGKLTADVVGNALLNSLDQLNKEAAAMPDTVGGAFTRLKNDIAVAIKDINNATGSTVGLAGMVDSARELVPIIKDELLRAFIMVDQWLQSNRKEFERIWEQAKGLMGDVWELVKGAAALVGFVADLAVKSGAVRVVFETLRFMVAGLQDGVLLIGAGFAKIGSIIMQSVLSPMNRMGETAANILEVFSPERATALRAAMKEANDYANTGGKYFDEVIDRFARGDTAVGKLDRELSAAKLTTEAAGKEADKAAVSFNKLKGGGPTEEQKKAAEKAAKALEQLNKEAQSYIESQRLELESIGKTEAQQRMLNAARAAAKAPTAAQSREIMSNADAIEALAAAEKEAADEKDRYAKAVESQLDARLQETLAAQQAVDNAQREIDTYGMGAAAITRYTIAKLEEKKATLMLAGAYGNEIDQLDRLIAKNGELLALQDQKDGLDSMFETSKVETFGQALREAFGEAGNSLAQLGSALQDYMDKQDQANKDRAKATLKYGAGTKKAAAEISKINAREEAERISAYANMAGAAKGFFSEHTAGYKVMEAVERGFRVYELAMTAQTVAAKLMGNQAVAVSATTSAATQIAANQAVGMSAAAVGVAEQAKGDPYSAWARMAAMAAVMASLGFAVAGGRGSKPNMQSAEEVQKRQGTGSVFGDASAKSDSISKSLELLEENSDMMLPLTQDMLSSLRGIEAAMSGLANIVVRTVGITTGDNFNIPTGTIGKTLGGLWGKTVQEITDAGIQFGGRVADLQNGMGYSQYANVTKTKSSWFGLSKSTSNSMQTGALDGDVAQQFGMVFKNLETLLQSAATGLGRDADAIGDAVRNAVIDTTKLSLQGLKGDELTAAINAVLSKATDDVAMAALPGFDAFRRLGEGYAETVIRVASGIEQAELALERFGIEAIKYAEIGNKQGDVAAEIVRQSILAVDSVGGVADIMRTLSGSASELASTYAELKAVQDQLVMVGLNADALTVSLIRGAGGLSELASGLDDYFDGFFSESEKVAAKTEAMRGKFAKLGLEMPATVEAFRALVENNPALAGQLAQLAGGFSDLMDAAQEASDAIKQAGGDARGDALSALERAVNAEKAVKQAAFDETMRGFDRVADASRAKISSLQALSQALNGARDSVGIEGDRASAQASLQSMLAIAKAGGVGTLNQASLQRTLGTLGRDSSEGFGSSREYMADRYQTAIAVGELADITDGALSTEQRTLTAIEKARDAAQAAHEAEMERYDDIIETAQRQLDALNGINVSVLSVAEALANFNALLAAGSYGNTGTQASNAAIVGAYGNALGRAPDAAGMAWWQERAAEGVSQDAINRAIATSTEAQDKIEALYQSILGRSSDEAGKAWWSDRMADGMSLAEVESLIRGSSENKGNDDVVEAVNAMKSELKLVMTAVASNTQRAATANEDSARQARQKEGVL